MGNPSQTQASPQVPSAVTGDINRARSYIPGDPNYKPNPALTGAINYSGSLFNPGGNIDAATNYINRSLSSGPGGTPNPYQGTINDILGGKYLTPDSNPFLQQEIGTLGQNFGRTLNQGIDTLNSQFNLAGQSPASSPRQGQISQFGRNALQDYTNSVAGLLGQNYSQGLGMINPTLSSALSSFGQGQSLQNQVLGMLGIPTQAAAGAADLSNLPFNMILQLLQNTPLSYDAYGPSQFSQNAQGIGSLLSGVGGLARGVGAFF